jgi:ankyrin repeat protein
VDKALKELPKALHEAYEVIWKRISDQGDEDAALATKVLSWLTYARSPMTTDMLQQALAIGPQDDDFDEDAVIHAESLVDVCAGLVVIDSDTRVIQYVHYTTKEFFHSAKRELFPESPLNVISTCLTFLLFEEATKERMPALYNYIADNWGHYARESPETAELVSKIVAFVQDESRLQHSVRHITGATPPSTSSTLMSGLHLASKFDLAMTIAELLTSDASDINIQDDEGRTPLYYAATAKGNSVVKLLLARADVDVNLSSYLHGSPLHGAIDAGHEVAAEMLLARGADAESRDCKGQRPIHKAVVSKQARALQAILKRRVNLNAMTNTGHTPLELAMPLGQNLSRGKGSPHSLKTGHTTPCLDLIMDVLTIDDINRGDMFFEAVKAGRPDIVEFLISKGAEISKKAQVYNQRTALHWACEQDFTQMISILIDNGSDVMAQDSRGFLPLHYAALAGREAAVRLLVASMKDFDVEARNGLTAVQLARLQQHTEIAAMLTQAGADDRTPPSDPSIGTGGRYNRNLYSGPQPAAATRLRTLSGKSIMRAEYDQHVERFIRAAESGDVETILLCFSKGVDVDERDRHHDKTALHWAAENGHIEITQLLLDWGGDLTLQDRYGETPLHYAADSGHEEIIKVMCEKGTDFTTIDDRGRTALRCARDNYHTQSVQILLEFWDGARIDTREVDAQGKTLSHWAAELGKPDICMKLLNLQSDDATLRMDNRGLTVMDYAQKHGVKDLIGIAKAKMATPGAQVSDLG